MATNPMQRKARNSFLLGMVVMLLITGIIIAFLMIQLMNKTKKEQEELKASVNVYILNQDVSSGQVITTDMLSIQTINRNLVPSNATGDISIITNYALQDKEGNDIYTKYKNDVASLYIRKDNTEYEVKKEEETQNYYITKNNQKEYIELNNVPLVAKVTMKKNTVITTEMISKSDNVITDDVRKQQYNMLTLPMDLLTGDYVDVRVMFPNGQDFIVVAKKEVEIPNIAGVDSTDTIWMNLREDEILSMSSAIVEAYRVKGTKLYVTKYAEAGMQNAATPTYPVNQEVAREIETNPNILENAMSALKARYNVEIRNNYIKPLIDGAGQEGQSNVESKMDESATNSKASRKEYLDSMSITTP